MLNRQVTVRINPELCNGCGLCVRVCPKNTLSLEDGRAVITGKESMNCGHCAAVCPTEAIKVDALDKHALEFATFHTADIWLKPGTFDVGFLVQLLRSRRSCRNFKDKQVECRLLEDLARIGATAPSGSNCQPWSFALLEDRYKVIKLADMIGDFYRRLNKMASNVLLRELMALFGKRELKLYSRQHMATVAEALDLWEATGKDPLFHGAPALMVIGADKNASCPAEDSLLAAANILLAAHCMGLGSCLIGFAVEAISRDRQIRHWLGFNDSQAVYAVIALGYPNEKYQRLAQRMPISMHYVDA